MLGAHSALSQGWVLVPGCGFGHALQRSVPAWVSEPETQWQLTLAHRGQIPPLPQHLWVLISDPTTLGFRGWVGALGTFRHCL